MTQSDVPSQGPSRKVVRFLRDQIWQFVGVVLAFVAIFVSYNVFWLQRPVKRLDVIVLSSTSLVDINPSASDEIFVSYRGVEVDNVAIVEIRVENSGNQPIVESDYSRPVTFTFGPSFEIIEVKTVNSDPPNIGLAHIQTVPSEVEMVPALLNSGDSATLRFTVIKQQGKNPDNDESLPVLKVDGRIAGVKEIRLKSPSYSRFADPVFLLLAVVLSVVGAFLANLLKAFFDSWQRKVTTWIERLMQGSKNSGEDSRNSEPDREP
jgi:hypothetical protein